MNTYLSLLTSQFIVNDEEDLILRMWGFIKLSRILWITIIVSQDLEHADIVEASIRLSVATLLALLGGSQWNILLCVDFRLCHLDDVVGFVVLCRRRSLRRRRSQFLYAYRRR